MSKQPELENQYPMTMAMLGKVLRDVRLATKIDANLNGEQVPWFLEMKPFQVTDIGIDVRAGDVMFSLPALDNDLLSQLFMKAESYHDKICEELREALASAFPETYTFLLGHAAELDIPSSQTQDGMLQVRLKTNGYLQEFLDKAEDECKRKLETIKQEVDKALIGNSNMALALPAPKPVTEEHYPNLMAAMRRSLQQVRMDFGLDELNYDGDAAPAHASVWMYEDGNVRLRPSLHDVTFKLPIPNSLEFSERENHQTYEGLPTYRAAVSDALKKQLCQYFGASWDAYAKPELGMYFLDAEGKFEYDKGKNITEAYLAFDNADGLKKTPEELSRYSLHLVIQANDNQYEAFLNAAEKECGLSLVQEADASPAQGDAFAQWFGTDEGGSIFGDDADDNLGNNGGFEDDRGNDLQFT